MRKQNNFATYVRQESVSMPYQSPKRTFWQYKFQVPNVGNNGKTYLTNYEFKINLPSLSEFEREINNKKFKVEPMMTVIIIQGVNRIVSRIKENDFGYSPLVNLIPESSQMNMIQAFRAVAEAIEKIRENLAVTYGTYSIDRPSGDEDSQSLKVGDKVRVTDKALQFQELREYKGVIGKIKSYTSEKHIIINFQDRECCFSVDEVERVP